MNFERIEYTMNLDFRHKGQFYLYTILWLIYLMQSVFIGDGTTISKILLALLLIWSFRHFINAINHSMAIPLGMLCILLVSYTLYGLFPIVENEVLYVESVVEVPPFYYIKSALISILPIYSFCHFAKEGTIDYKDIKLFSIFFLIIIIVDYFDNQAKGLIAAIEKGGNSEEFTNNVAYEFLYLFPYLYFFKKKYALPFMVCIIVFLFFSMKRGAIFVGVVCLVLFLYNWLKFANKQTKIYVFIGIATLVVCIGYFVVDLYYSSSYFQYRVEDTMSGNTSNRDIIVTQLLDAYANQSDIFQFVFGFGANGTLKHGGNFAHNDWVEILVNQGIIGALMLFLFYMSLFMFIQKIWKHDNLYYAFLTLFIILFSMTFFSMSICNMRPYTTLLLGYCLNQSFGKIKTIIRESFPRSII